MAAPQHRIRRIALESSACAAVLLALLLIIFAPVAIDLIAGGTPATFDIEHYFVPMSFLMDTALDEGEFPQWNPFTFCGTPFAANPQSALFYPPNFVRSILTPEPSPLRTYYGLLTLAVLQTIAAGLGVYWLARVHNLGYASAYCAAATFIFSNAYTMRLAEFHFVPALVWVPFIFIALHKLMHATRGNARRFWATGCGLLLAASLLSGFLQILVYLGVMLVVFAFFERLIAVRSHAGTGGALPQRMLGDLGYGIGAIVVAAAVSAVLLLSSAEFGQETFRAPSGGAGLQESTLDWDEVRAGLFSAADRENFVYFDASVLTAYFLAFLGVIAAGRRHVAVYGIVFLVMLDCSIGPPFPIATLVERFSPFKVALPHRAFVLAALPLAMLVGFGVQSLTTVPASNNRKRLHAALAIAAAAMLLTLAALPFTNPVVWILVALCAAGVATRWVNLNRWLIPAVCILFAADLVLTNQPRLAPAFDRTSALDIRALSNMPQADRTQNVRTIDLAPNRHLYRLMPAMNGYDPLYLGDVWQLLAPWHFNWNYRRILQAHETVEENPYPFLFLDRPFVLVEQYVQGDIPAEDPIFPATTAFVDTNAPLQIPEITLDDLATTPAKSAAIGPPQPVNGPTIANQIAWELPRVDYPNGQNRLQLNIEIPCSGELRLYTNDPDWPGHLPIYSQRFRQADTGSQRLQIPLPRRLDPPVRIVWNSNVRDCVPAIPHTTLINENAVENGYIEIEQWTHNKARITVRDLPGPRLLAFIDANYAGWSVSVDNEPTTLLTVNNAFKGVELSAGTHTVEFQFNSPTVRRGLALSIAATGTALALLSLQAASRAREKK